MTAIETNAYWQAACAVALSELSGMGPARLQSMLADRPPDAAWEGLASGSPPPALHPTTPNGRKLVDNWRRRTKQIEPLDVLERYTRAGVEVWHRYGRYPVRLLSDEHAPAVIFTQGRVEALANPTVAIIGTRHCTSEGRSVARVFGEELADAGVGVVSGLALGIDGAAHIGAVRAAFGVPAIGVVGCGLDVPYPRRHTDLWRDLREKGLLVSESPLGVHPEPWRFPARNRIIAGLADLVLVVESHETGGSLITVNEALDREVPVMVVPGSINSPASKGSNRLLADGALPVFSTQDLLDELRWGGRTEPTGSDAAVDLEPSDDVLVQDLSDLDRRIFEEVGWNSTSTDEILLRTCSSLGEVAVALAHLQAMGLVVGEDGWWRRSQRSEAPE